MMTQMTYLIHTMARRRANRSLLAKSSSWHVSKTQCRKRQQVQYSEFQNIPREASRVGLNVQPKCFVEIDDYLTVEV
jgi:hypothetical protein